MRNEGSLKGYNRSQVKPYYSGELASKAVTYIKELGEIGLWKYVNPNYIVHSIMSYLLASRISPPNASIIDIGCGLGYGSHILHREVRNGYVVGIDSSDSSIRIAKGIFREIEFLTGDFTKESTVDELNLRESFDAAVSIEVVEHIPPDKFHNFLLNLERVIRPGGWALLSTPVRESYDIFSYTEGHVNELSIDELTDVLNEIGLKVDRIWGMGFLSTYSMKIVRGLGLALRTGNSRRKFPKWILPLRGLIFRLLFPEKYLNSIPFVDELRKMYLYARWLEPKTISYSGRHLPLFQLVLVRKAKE